MSIDLNSFINNAVSQVRDAKKTGKKGRLARKGLKDGMSELEKTKKLIRDVAKACQSRAWLDTRLIVRKYTATCTHCKESTQTCDSIYLEQKHKRLGTILKRLDEIQVYSFPHIPRKIEHHECESYLCSECFIEYEPEEIWKGYHEPHPREFETLTKWQIEYRKFSREYDRKESWKEFKRKYNFHNLHLRLELCPK